MASKEGTKEHRRASSKSRSEKVSTLVLLARDGLEEYYTYFQQAGFGMFDGGAHPSDQTVEQYLDETEKHCGIIFKPEVRLRLWKALRYQWFRGPGHVAPFIERSKVRKLNLPKLDHKEVDSMIRIPDIDPDRKRQFIRTTRPSGQPSFRGPAVINMQFEVYKRQDDINHELQDIERCATEWQNRNARTMFTEDPREEIMRLRIRRVEEHVGLTLMSRRAACAAQRRIRLFLVFLRMLLLILTGLHAFAAYYRCQNVPRQALFWMVTGSKQFLSCGAYYLAYMVAYVVAQRWHHDAKSVKLQRLHYTCQRLTEGISDFRVETEGLRISTEQSYEGGYSVGRIARQKQPKQKKEKRRDRSRELKSGDEGAASGARCRVKKKRDKDEVMTLWAGKHAWKKLNPEGMLDIKQQVEESYKRLDWVAVPDLKRHDGNRMANYAASVGMPENYEDNLCIRPPQAPRPPVTLDRGLPRLPAPSEQQRTLMPPAPMLPPPPPDPTAASMTEVTRSFAHRISDVSLAASQTNPLTPLRGAFAAAAGASAANSTLPPFPTDAEDAGFDADAAARLAPWLPGRLPPRGAGPGQ